MNIINESNNILSSYPLSDYTNAIFRTLLADYIFEILGS